MTVVSSGAGGSTHLRYGVRKRVRMERIYMGMERKMRRKKRRDRERKK